MSIRRLCVVNCVALLAGSLIVIGASQALSEEQATCDDDCIAAEAECIAECPEGDEGDSCVDSCQKIADICFEGCESGE